MAVYKYIILLCAFSCLCCVSCELNLSEDSPCITKGLNGTCVNIYRCTTAVLTYLYTKVGFDIEKYQLPELPDICSYKNKEPVVCCTDCEIDNDELFRNHAIGPYGVIVNKEGPIVKQKCLDYFERLQYPCRGLGNIKVEKIWDEEKKCHNHSYAVALAVGGRDAEKWEFPHVALLGYGEDVESALWLCGGSVISERFILTAGHCTSTRKLGSITFAGLGLLKRTDPKEDWKIHKIKRIIVHPDYKPPSTYNDIALLETETEIIFGRDLLPACLEYEFEKIYTAEASGWGTLGHRQDLADTLQVVELTEFNRTECSGLYRPHRHLQYGYDHKKQMCFGSHTAIVDTCEGDSGGPLQITQFKCMYTIVGVTSFGKDCGMLDSAGVYTRVAYYVPWIESVVWPEETEARKKLDDEWLDKWLN